MKASNDMEGPVDPWRTIDRERDHVIDSYLGPHIVISDDLHRGYRRTPGLLQETGWQIRQDRVQDPASRAERAAETEAVGKVITGRKRRIWCFIETGSTTLCAR